MIYIYFARKIGILFFIFCIIPFYYIYHKKDLTNYIENDIMKLEGGCYATGI